MLSLPESLLALMAFFVVTVLVCTVAMFTTKHLLVQRICWTLYIIFFGLAGILGIFGLAAIILAIVLK